MTGWTIHLTCLSKKQKAFPNQYLVTILRNNWQQSKYNFNNVKPFNDEANHIKSNSREDPHFGSSSIIGNGAECQQFSTILHYGWANGTTRKRITITIHPNPCPTSPLFKCLCFATQFCPFKFVMKTNFWGLIGLIPGNSIFWELESVNKINELFL